MKESEERIIQLLNYKNRLTNHETPYEKKFFGMLLQAREIREAHKTTRSTIHRQYIFTEGRIAYIADFYLPRYKVVFEIDGMQHKKNAEYDRKRTEFINKEGIQVVRFWNNELESSNIIKRIVEALNKKPKGRTREAWQAKRSEAGNLNHKKTG